MTDKEIEIKIKLEDAEALMKKVESLGGKKISEYHEHDVMYDDGKGFFDAERVLRLRKTPKYNLLTYKEKNLESEHEHLLKRTEIETKFEDYEAMDAILQKLGFSPHRIKEKISTKYELEGFVIEFHKIPFLGDYIEIEAEEHRLPRILSVIGYNMSDGITKNYTSLFFDYCDLRGWNHDVPQTFEEENKHKAKA